MWGTPGTLPAACLPAETTGEERWRDACSVSAEAPGSAATREASDAVALRR